MQQTVPLSLHTIEATCGAARAGVLRTSRGDVLTPTFMAVGTLGGVKAMTPAQVKATGTRIMLGNTYHLLLRPGTTTLAHLGGLHRFSGWDGPMLTDSGGFQVFSLAQRAKTTERGVTFASHLDGSQIELSPESSIEAQRQIGADICMAFDDVPALPSSAERNAEACERSMRWAARCKAAFRGESAQGAPQYLFGIQQGGLDAGLRRASTRALVEIGFDGYAVGGLSVGESNEELQVALGEYVPLLPVDKPRYVMGIGWPGDLLQAIASGADMFDCVLPTRNARHGLAFTSHGKVNVKASRNALDVGPLDPRCDCETCTSFSLGYLRHLQHSGEQLAATLLSIHNLHYYATLMRQARETIVSGTFPQWRAETESRWIQRTEDSNA